MSLHTVLGASGSVGQAVIQELKNKHLPIRAVSRSSAISGVENYQADLLNAEEALQAIKGASHVYLCVGLPYETKYWEQHWQQLMAHVIAACIKEKAVLIFLDNIYMYGPSPLKVPFTEEHEQSPSSRKGKVRKKTASLMLNAIKEGKLQGVIGRSADFYGPGATYSPFYISFLERMLQGKAPQSIAKAGIPHTYANVADNGRALVALALDPSTYGQVWHLPVGEPISVEEMAALFNKELGTHFNVSFLPPLMRKILALFIPTLKEIGEMMYQFEHPYIMSFDKFSQKFPDFKVSSYEEGVADMIDSFKA